MNISMHVFVCMFMYMCVCECVYACIFMYIYIYFCTQKLVSAINVFLKIMSVYMITTGSQYKLVNITNCNKGDY